MPGLFAPTLQETQPILNTSAVTPSNTTANAINAVGGLFKALAESAANAPAPEKLTQAEKDRADLTPLAKRLNELNQQRKKLGPNYRAKVNETVNSFLNEAPELRTDAVGLAQTINGIDIGGTELDAPEAIYQGLQEFLGTPEGQVMATRAVRFDKDGNFNAGQTQANVQSMWLERQSQKLQLDATRDRVESIKLGEEERQIEVDKEATSVLSRHITSTQEAVNGLLAAAKSQLRS